MAVPDARSARSGARSEPPRTDWRPRHDRECRGAGGCKPRCRATVRAVFEGAVAQGGQVWWPASSRGRTSYTVFATTRERLAADPEPFRRMVRAIYRTQRWIAGQPADALAAAVASYFPDLDPGVLARSRPATRHTAYGAPARCCRRRGSTGCAAHCSRPAICVTRSRSPIASTTASPTRRSPRADVYSASGCFAGAASAKAGIVMTGRRPASPADRARGRRRRSGPASPA